MLSADKENVWPNIRTLSNITVATFYKSLEQSTTSEADSAAKSLAKSFLAFLSARLL